MWLIEAFADKVTIRGDIAFLTATPSVVSLCLVWKDTPLRLEQRQGEQPWRAKQAGVGGP